MIDVVRAVSATTPIQTPTIVDFTDSQFRAKGAPLRFRVRNSFARVFRDFLSGSERFCSKAAFALDGGLSNSQAWSEIEFHLIAIVTQDDVRQTSV